MEVRSNEGWRVPCTEFKLLNFRCDAIFIISVNQANLIVEIARRKFDNFDHKRLKIVRICLYCIFQ